MAHRSCLMRSCMLVALFCILQLVNGTEPPSTSPKGHERDVKPRRVHEQEYHKTFRHRHFFNYNLKRPQTGLSNLQVKNSNDILQHGAGPSLSLANFTLRSREPAAHWTDDPMLDTQFTLGSSGLFRTEPNTTDKETIVNLAKMTSDAYLLDPREPSWLNTSLGFNFTARFGWAGEGLRGHVFTTDDYSTVVVSFKGTTIDPRDKLSGRDRVNDNKLFSCCCGAQNPWHYAPVCNCTTGSYQCDATCLTNTLLQNDTYYDAALFIVDYFRSQYPQASFWTVGHSLGGAMASLVGMSLDIPAVTFESPPERLPAGRIGLLLDPIKNRYRAHHFGNTADPIYMGECNGLLTTCSAWGFDFESKCFTGSRCTYDTVKDKGWRSNIGNHRINYVIQNVLEAYDEVPECVGDAECADCEGWTFV